MTTVFDHASDDPCLGYLHNRTRTGSARLLTRTVNLVAERLRLSGLQRDRSTIRITRSALVDTNDLVADVGRPDTRALSQELVTRFIEKAKLPHQRPGAAPSYPAISLRPASALELVPGDPDALAVASLSWFDLATGIHEKCAAVARVIGGAYASVALRLLEIQQHADAFYAAAQTHGIDGKDLGLLLDDAHLAACPREQELTGAMIALRLRWMAAMNAFKSDLRPATVELEINA